MKKIINNPRKGVTLAELIVALAIIMIVTLASITMMHSSIKIEVRASAIIEANKSVETIVECFEFSSDASEFETLLESIEGYDITPVTEDILDSENNPTGKQYTIYTLERGSYSITIKHDTSINKIEINATYSDGKDIYKGITYNKG